MKENLHLNNVKLHSRVHMMTEIWKWRETLPWSIYLVFVYSTVFRMSPILSPAMICKWQMKFIQLSNSWRISFLIIFQLIVLTFTATQKTNSKLFGLQLIKVIDLMIGDNADDWWWYDDYWRLILTIKMMKMTMMMIMICDDYGDDYDWWWC